MFRNATFHTIDATPLKIEVLQDRLKLNAFVPCTSLQSKSLGFVEPMPGFGLAVATAGHILIAMRTQRKVVPPSVVREEVSRRIAEFAREQARNPSRKERRTIHEDALDSLLPKAFSTSRVTRAWIDTKANTLAIDATSAAASEALVSRLIRSIEQDLRIRPLLTVDDAAAGMTNWVAGNAPAGFTVDQDAVFAASGRSKSTVKFTNIALDGTEAQRQIQGGNRVTSLAMTFDAKTSFVLDTNLALRRIKHQTLMPKKRASPDVADPEALADFTLMADSLSTIISQIVMDLGGIREPESLAGEEAPSPTDDPLYEQASNIVRANGRASISLVQRHLRIGYNRAAALLEALEKGGVVTPMDNTGNRKVKKV
ncbi:recombination-associated protein RdgC [Burkholderia gladioli]|uniref:recombination-associated protein RdgC n=1 Tax=Burkholderia gladioli TaxID=28095 RepID=UPI0016420F74|nr:recombination-associated protein RdgC [Burkholderia gladioli]